MNLTKQGSAEPLELYNVPLKITAVNGGNAITILWDTQQWGIKYKINTNSQTCNILLLLW